MVALGSPSRALERPLHKEHCPMNNTQTARARIDRGTHHVKTLKAHANDLAAAFIKRQEAAGNPQAPAVPAEMFDAETGWLLDDSRPTRQPAPVTEMRRWYGWAPRRR
jgi:hypothetical protein